MHFLLITCQKFADCVPDEQHLMAALRARGHTAEPAVWDDPAPDWAAADALLLRNPWDYFDRPQEFHAWLAARGEDSTVFNPVDLVQWNAHKGYLLELAGRGVPVPPTVFIPAGEAGQPGDWDGGTILKPAIGGTAKGCFRFGPDDGEALAAALAPADEDRLLQPFLPSVQTEGEASLMFFGNEFSHAVVKRPAQGDFRVQAVFGGEYARIEPPAGFREAAEQALAGIPATVGAPLYARVDLVRGRGGTPELMELEIFEPELFFRYCEEAAPRFVAALEARLHGA